MITVNLKGRLGNQMFQIAAAHGTAKKFDTSFRMLSRWKYAQYFEGNFPIHLIGDFVSDITIVEKEFYYHSLEDSITTEQAAMSKVTLNGYFQSERYWSEDTIKLFKFNKDFEAVVLSKFLSKLPEHLKKMKRLGIHVRRGDYVDNPNYYQLDMPYYIKAIDYMDEDKEYLVIVFSDDIEWCKVHFSGLDNVFFSEGNSDIEDLILMSHCDKLIISNSTFSWWGARLAQERDRMVVVIRPNDYFDGKLAETHNTQDFYPDYWLRGDDSKIALTDTTVIIPVMFDHKDRVENLILVVSNLLRYFEIDIIVMEETLGITWNSNGLTFPKELEKVVKRVQCNNGKFHRTKMLNDMTRMAETDTVINLDADVIVPPLQIFEATRLIRKGDYELIIPYSYVQSKVARYASGDLWKTNDIATVNVHSVTCNSVGGIVVYDKDVFLDNGGENENMISYAPEDKERWYRFSILTDTTRLNGNVYHLDHYLSIDSTNKHRNFKNNQDEWDKVFAMSREDLFEYINTWKWTGT